MTERWIGYLRDDWGDQFPEWFEQCEAIIDEVLTGHLDVHGGYPHDFMVIEVNGEDLLIVADLDNGKERRKTELKVYTKSFLLKWNDEYQEAVRDNPEMEIPAWEYCPDE